MTEVTSNELLGCIHQMGDWVRHLDECELNRWYKGNAVPKRCTCGLQGILDNVSAVVKRASAHETSVLHEGVRQSYLKAVELSLDSGMLGNGDRSDLLELYLSLWPRAPSDIRADRLRNGQKASVDVDAKLKELRERMMATDSTENGKPQS